MKFNGLRFTNAALLVLVLILTISGLYGLFWTTSEAVFTLHRASGWALLALLPWKGLIVYRSLRRKLSRPASLASSTRFLKIHLPAGAWLAISLFLAGLTLLVLALGLLWKGRFGPPGYPLRQTAISWHWMLALGLLLPFALHVLRRWPRPRKVDFLSRRALLRAALAAPLAALGYFGYQRLAGARENPQEPVRFTGSRRAGWFSGNAYPVTHAAAPDPEQIALETWRLEVTGAAPAPIRLDYATLSQLPIRELQATIDCTLGWYARQTWRGVLLVDLLQYCGLDRALMVPGMGDRTSGSLVRSAPLQTIRLVSVTDYAHDLPWEAARQVLLATHVGGELLSPDHGAPLRAVVPTRRGWFWVKWLSQVQLVNL